MKHIFNRVIVIIMDGSGCGVQNDYKQFHNKPSNTLKSLYKYDPNLKLKNLEGGGLSRILFNKNPKNNFVAGVMTETTMGNDTFAGVWEMMGVIFKKRFRTGERKLPTKIIKLLENKIGCPIVGNEYISGFQVLDKYFDEHQIQKGPIMYLADDGVVLFAAHENIIPPKILNKYAKEAANILKDYRVTRIITRPFMGKKGHFIRTVKNRADIIINNKAFNHSILSKVQKGNVNLKVTQHLHNVLDSKNFIEYIRDNLNNKQQLSYLLKDIDNLPNRSITMLCLEEFDLLAHEKKPTIYIKRLKELDSYIGKIKFNMAEDDLLILTADHGCNPILDMRGHTREYVPIIIFSKKLINKKIWLGKRSTFADLGQTILYNFGLDLNKHGEPIYEIF